VQDSFWQRFQVPPETLTLGQLLLDFGLALAIGALIGVERERKRRTGELATGGLRTFVLIAEAGALAALLSRVTGTPWVFLSVGLLLAGVLVAGYVMEVRSRPESIGLTTEVAGIVTYLLGGAVIFGAAELAVALAITTAAVLAFKEPLHGLVARIGREDLEATLKLLIATFVVLPVLPNEPVDPLGVLNPYAMWLLVVLISALSLVGYVATRLFGPQRGLVATGLAGGLVSSTAVTLGFARESRLEGHGGPDALGAGLLLAWAVMFVRVGFLVAIVHHPLLAPLVVPLGAMGLASLGAAAVFFARGGGVRPEARTPEVNLKNPFRLTASIRFALVFALVLVVVELVRRNTPPSGLYAVAALAGLTDVDAITLSMAEQARAGGALPLSAGAIAVAAITNTAVKCGLVVGLGSRPLRRRAAVATAVVMAAGGVGFWLG